jgi:glucokinase
MSEPRDNLFVLAGDIGGTKTNMGLFSVAKGPLSPVAVETFSSAKEPNLSRIVRQFLDRHPASIAGACFGVAGPVVKGCVKTTNLPWDVSEDEIKKEFTFQHVRLVNDLTATAMAIPLLPMKDFQPLNRARAEKGQDLSLIAPGTGLGLSLISYQKGTYVPVSSEGGHADFSPNAEAELNLWRYLHEQFGHVSYERVLSGAGLLNIYKWLAAREKQDPPDWLREMFAKMDPARVISETALANKDPLCVRALDRFVSILGALAGNVALMGMSTGGVYLGGGIPPKVMSKLMDGTFMRAFTNKGRFQTLLEKIPVRVILNDRAALTGAADYALDRARVVMPEDR